MDDYYTLITRAVSALSDNTADARRNLYERARVALTSSLIRHDPPISEADFDRERSALEASIARVEREASVGQAQTADSAKPEPNQSHPAEETTGSTGPPNILPGALPQIREDQAHTKNSASETGITRLEQKPSIGQAQTADVAKTEPIQSRPAEETTRSTGPANVSPAALPQKRDQAHPTVSALEAGITRVGQEPSIGRTQTADAAKPELIQSYPAKEATGSTVPANFLPAALAQITSALEADITKVDQEPSIGQTQIVDTDKIEPTQAQPAAQETIAPNEPADTLPAILRPIRDPTLPRIMPIRRTFVYVNRLLLGVTCVMSIAFAVAIFLKPSWVTHIFDYLLFAACSAVILCTLGMLPVAQAKVSKVGLLCTFLISSYLLGLTTWVLGMLVTLKYLETMGLMIGLSLGIVGVVPLGIVAAAINADWSMVAMILVGVLVTYGARDLASNAIGVPPLAQSSPSEQAL